jgi:hypothetical protein
MTLAYSFVVVPFNCFEKNERIFYRISFNVTFSDAFLISKVGLLGLGKKTTETKCHYFSVSVAEDIYVTGPYCC